MPGVQQPSRTEEEVQNKKQVTPSDNKERKAPKKELENTEEEFSEEEEIREEDSAKEEDGFNKEQASVEVEASEDIQTSSEKLDIDFEKDAAEEQKEVAVAEKGDTLQEEQMVTNEIEKTAVDEIQTALEDSDHVAVETEEIMDEKMEVPVENIIKIHSETTNMVTRETGKEIEVPTTEEIQAPLEDSSTETEAAAVEKQVKLTSAQEMQTGSEETDVLSNIVEDVFSEEHAGHAGEEIHNVSNEISTAEIKTQEDGYAEQETVTAVEDIQIPSDETDIATNGNVDNQIKDVIPPEIE